MNYKCLIFFIPGIFWPLFFLAQVADIPCNDKQVFATVGAAVHSLHVNATDVSDDGVFADSPYSTLFGLAYGNDILQNSDHRTLYSSTQSGLEPCSLLRWNNGIWDIIRVSDTTYHNVAAYGPYIYFQHVKTATPNRQHIVRLMPDGSLLPVFTDTSLVFTVSDLAVDTSGNLYVFRGTAIGATTELTVISPQGNILQQYFGNLNNLSTFFGAFFLDGTLFLGWGTTNSSFFPVILEDNLMMLGAGLSLGFSAKDLAGCHQTTSNLITAFPKHKDVRNFYLSAEVSPGLYRLYATEGKDFRYHISDLQGKIILPEKSGISGETINLQNLSSGVYFISVDDDQGHWKRIPFFNP